MPKVMLLDYVHELAGAGFKPVSVPAYLDARGAPVVVKNGEGWPIVRLPNADGWRDELIYWYRAGAEGPCHHCMAPAGAMLLTVSPSYAVDIESEGQALSIARAWKLARAPKVGRVVKYPYGRVLRGTAQVGTVHARCMVERMVKRGWSYGAVDGRHADAPVWPGLSDATVISDVRFSAVERPYGPILPRPVVQVGTASQTQLDRPMRPERKSNAVTRRTSVRAIRGTISQTTLERAEAVRSRKSGVE